MYMHKAYYFTISQVWDYLELSITHDNAKCLVLPKIQTGAPYDNQIR